MKRWYAAGSDEDAVGAGDAAGRGAARRTAERRQRERQHRYERAPDNPGCQQRERRGLSGYELHIERMQLKLLAGLPGLWSLGLSVQTVEEPDTGEVDHYAGREGLERT